MSRGVYSRATVGGIYGLRRLQTGQVGELAREAHLLPSCWLASSFISHKLSAVFIRRAIFLSLLSLPDELLASVKVMYLSSLTQTIK